MGAVAMGIVACQNMDWDRCLSLPSIPPGRFSEMMPKPVCLHQPWQVNHIHSSSAALMAGNRVYFS